MAEMTLEQKKAIALANARLRAKAKATASAPTESAPEGKSVGGFLQNIPIDAYNTAKDIGQSVYAGGKKLVTDPVGAARDVYDAANTAGVTAVGGIENAYNMAAPQNMQIARRPEMEMASQVGAHLKDKYWDNLGDTVYNHPVQTAMDASSLLYGGEGAAARVLGEGAMATKALGKAAELTNPLNAVAKPIQAVRNTAARGSAMREMRANAPTYEQNVADTAALYKDLRTRGISVPAQEFADVNAKNATIGQINSYDAPRSNALVQDMKAATAGDQSKLQAAVKAAQDRQATAEANLRAARATGRPDVQVFERQAANAAYDTRQAIAKAQTGTPVYFDQLDDFRKRAGAIANDRGLSVSQTDKAAAAQIGEHIDDVLNATSGAPEIQHAREMARRNIIARQIKEMDRKSGWYTSGDESGLRNQFSSFGKKSGKGLTPLEEKIAKKVVQREGVHGLLNTLGSKLTQTGLLVSAVPALGWGLGIPAMVAGGGVSLGSRALSAAMTNAKADQLLKTVLAGKPAQNAALRNAKRLPLKTRGLLLGSEGVGLLGGHRAP